MIIASTLLLVAVYQYQVVLNTMRSLIDNQAELQDQLFRKIDDRVMSLLTLQQQQQQLPAQYNYSYYNNNNTAGLHVVVAHCDKPLDWIWESYLKDVEYKSITIISKCGHRPNEHSSLPPNTRVVTSLPNVGRCDHSYAYFIQNMDSLLKDYRNNVNDQVMFMKDNDNTYRGNFEGMYTLQQMMETTDQKQFACASYIKTTPNDFEDGERATNVAQLWTLGSFYLEDYSGARNSTSYDFKSPIFPLANWLTWLSMYNSVDISLTTDLAPVCFGGHFMTTVDRIKKAPVGTWQPVLDSLSRGDNIEEGHFMERLWAPLLSPPIPPAEQRALMEKKVHFHGFSHSHPYTGLLVVKGADYYKYHPEELEVQKTAATAAGATRRGGKTRRR
jgi:hypothetical protein